MLRVINHLQKSDHPGMPLDALEFWENRIGYKGQKLFHRRYSSLVQLYV